MARESTATIQISATTSATGTGSASLTQTLPVGDTAFSVEVDATGGTRIYALTVTRRADLVFTNYDSDGDWLVDISTLDQLNAIRYDPDGDGVPTAAGTAAHAAAFVNAAPNMGCAMDDCIGYELGQDLDFDGDGRVTSDDDHYWNSGAGWTPIETYDAVFDGNSRTISHLFINASGGQHYGLFSHTGANAEIRSLGLLDVDVASTGRRVGGLVGRNVGEHHRLVRDGPGQQRRPAGRRACRGENSGNGSIAAIYSTAHVTGSADVGGLVGAHYNGEVRASYATARLHATGDNAGGLVGSTSKGGGDITASYAGRATSAVAVGSDDTDGNGLIDGIETESAPSYPNADLAAPIGYSGIYASWNIDVDSAAAHRGLQWQRQPLELRDGGPVPRIALWRPGPFRATPRHRCLGGHRPSRPLPRRQLPHPVRHQHDRQPGQ